MRSLTRTLPLSALLLAPAFAQVGPTRPLTPSTNPTTSTAFSGIVLANDDECSTSTDLQVGFGSYLFDTSLATTGVVAQADVECTCSAGTGFASDIWFTWQADADGVARFSMDGTDANFAEKLAIYAVTGGCPTAAPLACNDEWCFNVPPVVSLQVTTGDMYLVRLGGHLGAATDAGPGVLDITLGAFDPCGYQGDLDHVEQGWGSSSSSLYIVYMRYHEAEGGADTIHSMSIRFGWPDVPPNFGNPDVTGDPIRVAIWNDPTNDRDPVDAVLLWEMPSVIENFGNGIPDSFAVPNVPVTGGFWVGFEFDVQSGGGYPGAMDGGADPGASWVVNQFGSPIDLSDVASAAFPPVPLYLVGGGTGGWLIRAEGINHGCSILGAHFCPTLSNSTGDIGHLDAIGSPFAAANIFTLEASTLPANQFGYFLASLTWGSGTPVSSGVLCLNGDIGRFNSQAANSGSGGAFEAVIDLTSMPTNPNQPVLAGQTWGFQCWYRDGAGVSNFTEGLQVNFN